jgi:hypothetical protein
MEVILVPHVSLVDITGKRLGNYNDDPGWWQQTQNNSNNNVIITASHTELNSKKFGNNFHSGKVSPMNSHEPSTSSKAMLIDNTEESNTNIQSESGETEEKGEALRVLGETLLHIAIMYNDLATIKILLEKKGYNVNQRCSAGKFTGGFNTKLMSKSIKNSQYDNLAYYGEYPLVLAACFSTKEIYDFLIDQGADPNLPGI